MRRTIREIGLSLVFFMSGCSRPQSGSAGDTGRPRVDSDTAPQTPTAASKPALPPASTRPPASSKKAEGSESTAVAPISSGRPHLTNLSPSSGSLGSGAVITVVVSGSGFTATGNRVFFGSIDLGELPSDGRTLRFAVPQIVPSKSEVPPMAVQAGRYFVYVVNAKGVSDSLSFTLRD